MLSEFSKHGLETPGGSKAFSGSPWNQNCFHYNSKVLLFTVDFYTESTKAMVGKNCYCLSTIQGSGQTV